MASDELVELRSPVDDDDARREAHRFPASAQCLPEDVRGERQALDLRQVCRKLLQSEPRRMGGGGLHRRQVALAPFPLRPRRPPAPVGSRTPRRAMPSPHLRRGAVRSDRAGRSAAAPASRARSGCGARSPRSLAHFRPRGLASRTSPVGLLLDKLAWEFRAPSRGRVSGRIGPTRTATTEIPIGKSLVRVRPASIRSRNRGGASTSASASCSRASNSSACCCASSVSSEASCSRGVDRHWPL